MQIGLPPNTDWPKDTVELVRFVDVQVEGHARTDVPGMFVAGHCTTTPYQQIVIAAGDASKAALSDLDHLIRSSVPAA